MQNSLTNPLVTVYIPSYNYESFLPECLDSITSQSYDNMEILIYDDGSTDNSVDVIKEYMKIDSRIYLESERENRGPNTGINKMLDKVKGDFFAMVCADDKLSPNYWETVLSYFSDPRIGFVSVGCMLFGEGIPKEGSLFRPLCLNNRLDILEGNRVFVSSPFRIKMQKEVGKFDENTVLSDWDFWIRCVLKGWNWETCREPLFWRRIHANSITTKNGLHYHYNSKDHIYLGKKWSKLLKQLNIRHTTMIEE